MFKNLTVEQKKLAGAMSAISERCYSAGWMENLEYVLWDALTTGEKTFGQGKITAHDIKQIAALSHICAGWIYFDIETEETAIDIISWTFIFQKAVQESPDMLRD